jgi:hypothetical protein
VICPDCSRGYTYLISIDFGTGGWISEVDGMTTGELVIPTNFKDTARFFAMVDEVPVASRVPIALR